MDEFEYSVGDPLLELHPGDSSMYVESFPKSGPLQYKEKGPINDVYNLALVERKMVSYGGVPYVFVPTAGCWYNLRSNVAGRFLCDMLGFENVTVNYYAAIEPYLDVIQYQLYSPREIPQSFCVGTWRLEVSKSYKNSCDEDEYEGKIVEYKAVYMLTMDIEDGSEDRDIATSAFAYMPVRLRCVPKYTRSDVTSRLEITLSHCLSYHQLNLLRWVIGNSLLDPVRNPRLMFFYGEGGSGKSTLISLLTSVLKGVCSPLSKDYLGGNEKTLTEDDFMRATCHRFVTFGDVSLFKGSSINSSILKQLCGNDIVVCGRITGRLNCAGLFGSNHLWYPVPSLQQTWFTRRVIAVYMSRSVLGQRYEESYTDEDALHFCGRCIQQRLDHEQAPVSAEDAILTIFGKKSPIVTRGICFDDYSTSRSWLAATFSISIAALMDRKVLIDLVRSFSPTLIGYHYGVECITGLNVRVISPI